MHDGDADRSEDDQAREQDRSAQEGREPGSDAWSATSIWTPGVHRSTARVVPSDQSVPADSEPGGSPADEDRPADPGQSWSDLSEQWSEPFTGWGTEPDPAPEDRPADVQPVDQSWPPPQQPAHPADPAARQPGGGQEATGPQPAPHPTEPASDEPSAAPPWTSEPAAQQWPPPADPPAWAPQPPPEPPRGDQPWQPPAAEPAPWPQAEQPAAPQWQPQPAPDGSAATPSWTPQGGWPSAQSAAYWPAQPEQQAQAEQPAPPQQLQPQPEPHRQQPEPPVQQQFTPPEQPEPFAQQGQQLASPEQRFAAPDQHAGAPEPPAEDAAQPSEAREHWWSADPTPAQPGTGPLVDRPDETRTATDGAEPVSAQPSSSAAADDDPDGHGPADDELAASSPDDRDEHLDWIGSLATDSTTPAPLDRGPDRSDAEPGGTGLPDQPVEPTDGQHGPDVEAPEASDTEEPAPANTGEQVAAEASAAQGMPPEHGSAPTWTDPAASVASGPAAPWGPPESAGPAPWQAPRAEQAGAPWNSAPGQQDRPAEQPASWEAAPSPANAWGPPPGAVAPPPEPQRQPYAGPTQPAPGWGPAPTPTEDGRQQPGGGQPPGALPQHGAPPQFGGPDQPGPDRREPQQQSPRQQGSQQQGLRQPGQQQPGGPPQFGGPPQSGPAQQPPDGLAQPGGRQQAPGGFRGAGGFGPGAPGPQGFAGPVPTNANDFAAQRATEPEQEAPTRGLPGFMHRATGGRAHLSMTAAERLERDRLAGVRANFPGVRQITFVNPKGGSAKTTAALLTAMTFGQSRGGYVLAWDNNETQGTLGVRSQPDRHQRTVRDLLDDLPRLGQSRVGDLGVYVRSQGEAMFDVLASDEQATAGEMMTATAFEAVRDVVSRFYRIICVDTGNNVRAENWASAIASTDQLVVTSSVRWESAYSASRMLDHLEQTGRAELVRNAVTVLTLPRKYKSTDVTPVESHFKARTRTVLHAPFDPLLDQGDAIAYAKLAAETREAYLAIAAAIAEGLNRQPQPAT